MYNRRKWIEHQFYRFQIGIENNIHATHDDSVTEVETKLQYLIIWTFRSEVSKYGALISVAIVLTRSKDATTLEILVDVEGRDLRAADGRARHERRDLARVFCRGELSLPRKGSWC